MYLNTINYGSGAYGIQAAVAALLLEGRHASSRWPRRPPSWAFPSRRRTTTPSTTADNCLARRNLVLDRMLSNGYITQEEHDAAQQARALEVNETDAHDRRHPRHTRTSPATCANELKEELASMSEDGDTQGRVSPSSRRSTLPPRRRPRWQPGTRPPRQTGLPALTGDASSLPWRPSTPRRATSRRSSGAGTTTDEPGEPRHGHWAGPGRQSGLLVQDVHPGGGARGGHRSARPMIDCSAQRRSIPGLVRRRTSDNDGLWHPFSMARAFAVSSNTGFARLCHVARARRRGLDCQGDGHHIPIWSSTGSHHVGRRRGDAP